ncbi:methyltransferase [Aureococcus anophagefferens]|nr:methyltransferase [Aureococcus anophagefferens]
MLRATAALLLAGASARGIDPQYAENLTLYHVNPLHEGVIPSDMDTSDLNGDIFFDLKSAVTPVECASGRGWSGDCENGEVADGDLVISKLVVEVDSRFGEYGMCNICTFGRYGDCTWDKYVEEPWGCWSGNVWKKTGGEWYSTFKGARCGDGDGACTWRVAEVVKVVNKTCSDDSVFSNIEAHDAVGCFDGCGKARRATPRRRAGSAASTGRSWAPTA